jgi:hypothetical protein
MSIIGKADYPWMDTEACLAEFGGTRKKAAAEYRRFVREGVAEGRNPSLTGGGLIRSHGGWSQVMAMRRRGQKEEYDERILGGGNFVAAIFKEVEDRQLRQTKHKRSGQSIQKIIDTECRGRQINERELKAGGKRSRVSETRAIIASRCKEELGSSCAEIARHLGVNTSSIVRSIERAEKGKKE